MSRAALPEPRLERSWDRAVFCSSNAWRPLKHLAFSIDLVGSILPRGNEVGVDPKVFGIAVGIAATTCVAFGLFPALHLSRPRLTQAMASRTVRYGQAMRAPNQYWSSANS